MGWLFVRASVGSSSDSGSPSETPIEPWVMSSGTPTQRPLLWRGWRTRPWIGLLSGTISAPSTASRGVESWISSLRACRANPTPSLAGGALKQTSATCGPPSSECSTKCAPPWSSLRTSQRSFSGFDRSASDYASWVTSLRREYSQRLRSARRTAGRGCSYSRNEYPTPAVNARTNRGGQNPEGPERPSLETWAKDWPTPNAHEGRRPGSDATSTQGANLKRDAEAWATPQARDWRSEQHQKTDEEQYGTRGRPLGRQVLRATGAGSIRGSGPLWQTPRVGTHGVPGADATHGGQPKGKRLNALFVEWLIGWPQGWSACEPVEMVSYRLWLRTHSEFLRKAF